MRAALLALAALGGGEQEVVHVDASLELDGRLLSFEAVRGLAGGEMDLVLAVQRRGQRELRVHAVEAERVDPLPRRVVPMLEDVVAWGAAELRADPGRELLLLTPGGAFSYSLLREGYRDNALGLARAELLHDLADPGALPRWRYVLPGFGPDGRDGLLLAERGALSLWTPQAGEGTYARAAQFQGRARAVTGKEDDGPSGGRGAGPFVLADSDVLLADEHGYRAPALVDLTGKGRRDLVDFDGEQLHVHLAAAAQPTRSEPLPDYLKAGEPELAFAFHDLDGDGIQDLLVTARPPTKGLGNVQTQIFVLLNDGRASFPPKPQQVLRFEAARVTADVRDIDGDGRADLVVRTFTMPSLLETVTGPRFMLTQLVFFGEKSGFARQAAVRYEQTFDESGAAAAIANYQWVLDCDGDGIADLCSVDLAGRVSVRRLRQRSGFLRGTRWELDASPWRSFEARGSIGSLVVRDLNGDGLGDLVSAGEQRLSIFLSVRRGGRR